MRCLDSKSQLGSQKRMEKRLGINNRLDGNSGNIYFSKNFDEVLKTRTMSENGKET